MLTLTVGTASGTARVSGETRNQKEAAGKFPAPVDHGYALFGALVPICTNPKTRPCNSSVESIAGRGFWLCHDCGLKLRIFADKPPLYLPIAGKSLDIGGASGFSHRVKGAVIESLPRFVETDRSTLATSMATQDPKTHGEPR